jgi:AcrR family transcriptional regulator
MSERQAKPRLKKSERRQLVIEHARELFARQGYAATTMSQLAESSGLTPSALSKLFADRAAVLCGLVEEFQSGLATIWDSVPADVDWAEKLQALLRTFRTGIRSQAGPVRVLLKLLAEGDSEARVAMAEAFAPTIQAMAELVRGGQGAGVFRRTLDAEQAAWEILRALFGLALLDRVEPVSPTDPDHPSFGIECLLHGLLKTDV